MLIIALLEKNATIKFLRASCYTSIISFPSTFQLHLSLLIDVKTGYWALYALDQTGGDLLQALEQAKAFAMNSSLPTEQQSEHHW